MLPIGPTNIELADALDQMGEVLVRQGEPNPYRIQAYLQAAAMVRDLDEPVARLYGEGGRDALTELPGIGVSLAHHLAQYIETGRIGLRDRLLRTSDPAALLATVPGVSDRLAQRLVDELGIESLADLERAAHDGRLMSLDGVGPRRTEAIRLQLNSILNRSARRRARRLRRQVAQLAAVQRRAEIASEHAAEAVAEASEPAAPVAEERPVATIYSLFPPAAA
ncbi:helix-hairpin-helix domain-containing protein [Rubrivirga sp. IMCC45206]|uniref:helix-hairpin-helix domain-containing protein n=1 Tax=Rubrivirga sp. IMCC45206 TaxID=3391614 RepID=UPI00398F9DED